MLAAFYTAMIVGDVDDTTLPIDTAYNLQCFKNTIGGKIVGGVGGELFGKLFVIEGDVNHGGVAGANGAVKNRFRNLEM